MSKDAYVSYQTSQNLKQVVQKYGDSVCDVKIQPNAKKIDKVRWTQFFFFTFLSVMVVTLYVLHIHPISTSYPMRRYVEKQNHLFCIMQLESVNLWIHEIIYIYPLDLSDQEIKCLLDFLAYYSFSLVTVILTIMVYIK